MQVFQIFKKWSLGIFQKTDKTQKSQKHSGNIRKTLPIFFVLYIPTNSILWSCKVNYTNKSADKKVNNDDNEYYHELL